MSTLEFEWAEPEAEIVAQKLIGLAEGLEDIREPMAAAAFITADDIQERFATQSDPSGAPWQEWSESYEPFALAHGSGRILDLTGDLREAATSPSNFIPTDEGLFLDTSQLPEYWAWNNFGAQRSVAAGGETARQKQVANAAFRKRAGRGGVKGFGALAGENLLPERPFIGLSKEAQAKIAATFEAWLVGEVALAQSSTGRTFLRHSKRVGGRFAPK